MGAAAEEQVSSRKRRKEGIPQEDGRTSHLVRIDANAKKLLQPSCNVLHRSTIFYAESSDRKALRVLEDEVGVVRLRPCLRRWRWRWSVCSARLLQAREQVDFGGCQAGNCRKGREINEKRSRCVTFPAFSPSSNRHLLLHLPSDPPHSPEASLRAIETKETRDAPDAPPSPTECAPTLP
jgi:hypothetical protein